MLMKIVEKGEHGINMCCMTVFCTVLTSFVFLLVPFAFCFAGIAWRWLDGTFWSEEN
jgi:hypothetical protein